jgi:hypothetical protein
MSEKHYSPGSTGPGFGRIRQEKRAEWEGQIFSQISGYLSAPPHPFFCRLHFLITEHGGVYYLCVGELKDIDKGSWWHSTQGNVYNVRARLISDGIAPIEVVQVRSSSRGNIPYFARTSDEEPGVGWNDRELCIFSADLELECRTRHTHESYLAWATDRRLQRR